MRAILTYHSIDASGSPISLDRSTFEQHVTWLASGAVRVVDVDELLTLDDREDAVAITFDDGFANLRDQAWPLLHQHGLPATVFVVSDLAGSTNSWEDTPGSAMPVLPLLSLDELAKLAEQGLRLGVHSRTHAHLSGLESAQLTDEVAGAKEHIVRETGRTVTGFAYPYGEFDDAAVAAVRDCFDWGCSAELRVLKRDDDRHLLPRLDAYYFQAPGRLEAWGKPSFSTYVRVRAAARKVRAGLRRLAGR